MSALSLLKKVKVQTLSFEKHPCRELDQEMMIHYLNGLALLTNEDGNVCDKEEEYLSILINSFGLSEDMLETFVAFAQNPDEKLILDMMQSFMSKDIKYNFMVDAMMIASIDGNVHENEKAVIDEYFEMFKLTKEEAKDLRYIYEMFYKQDGNALFRYFGQQTDDDIFIIKKELFQYLIDYYKIDFKYELQKEEKKALKVEFFKPTFSSGKLEYNYVEIGVKPINNYLFSIFLNELLLTKQIEKNGDSMFADVKTKDLLFDPASSEIEFKENKFSVKGAKRDEKVTGMTYLLAERFAEWMSEKDSEYEYKLSAFTYYYIYMKDFKYPIFGEFYYGSYSGYTGYYYARDKFFSNNDGGYFNYATSDGSYNVKTSSTHLSNKTSFRVMRKFKEETK